MCKAKDQALLMGLCHARALTAKNKTDLEVLKAALLFPNCLNSTCHLCLIRKHNFLFSGHISSPTLKVTSTLNVIPKFLLLGFGVSFDQF